MLYAPAPSSWPMPDRLASKSWTSPDSITSSVRGNFRAHAMLTIWCRSGAGSNPKFYPFHATFQPWHDRERGGGVWVIIGCASKVKQTQATLRTCFCPIRHDKRLKLAGGVRTEQVFIWNNAWLLAMAWTYLTREGSAACTVAPKLD